MPNVKTRSKIKFKSKTQSALVLILCFFQFSSQALSEDQKEAPSSLEAQCNLNTIKHAALVENQKIAELTKKVDEIGSKAQDLEYTIQKDLVDLYGQATGERLEKNNSAGKFPGLERRIYPDFTNNYGTRLPGGFSHVTQSKKTVAIFKEDYSGTNLLGILRKALAKRSEDDRLKAEQAFGERWTDQRSKKIKQNLAEIVELLTQTLALREEIKSFNSPSPEARHPLALSPEARYLLSISQKLENAEQEVVNLKCELYDATLREKKSKQLLKENLDPAKTDRLPRSSDSQAPVKSTPARQEDPKPMPAPGAPTKSETLQ